MTNQTDNLSNQHTLHAFDVGLGHLHCLLLEMTDLLIYQLEQAMQAFDYGDMKQALKVISRDSELNLYEVKIDSEVLAVIALYNPVADDLHAIISTSKIAVELEKIGNEVADFARVVAELFNPKINGPTPKLLTDIDKIANTVKIMLARLMISLKNMDSNQACELLQYYRDCETELQEGTKHQLAFISQDAHMIGLVLDFMQIMKALERCGEHCRNIAEYIIFMFDGIDVRHSSQADRSAPSFGKLNTDFLVSGSAKN